MELAPCLSNDEGKVTQHNPHGWTMNSSMIFIDQPAGVGFSQTDPGVEIVSNSFVGASDMYIFLQIYLTEVFPEKRDLPFHISGESYGVSFVHISISVMRLTMRLGSLCPYLRCRDCGTEQ